MGTDVVVDILFFWKRKVGELEGDVSWLDTEEFWSATDDGGAICFNRWFAWHPDLVLGRHALTSEPSARPTHACPATATILMLRCLQLSISFWKTAMMANPWKSVLAWMRRTIRPLPICLMADMCAKGASSSTAPAA